MATERDVPVRLWRCPECKAEGFWPAEPLLPGGPALCAHPSSGYVSTLYVPAVLSEELVERVARAWWSAPLGPQGQVRIGEWDDLTEGTRAAIGASVTEGLRAAGFVSEPSTGGE